MTKIWLVVYFFINGVWVHGENFDGWSPREVETLELCQRYAAQYEVYEEAHAECVIEKVDSDR